VIFFTATTGRGASIVLGFGIGVERSILRTVVLATGLLLSCPSTAQDTATRVYVRRIEFTGVSHTSDFVLRRELLLHEGGYLNTVALDRSVQRLKALPFVDDATPQLREVTGLMDVVDVVIEVHEAPARRYGGGGGYSEAFRTSLHGYFVNEDLFGLGQRLAIGVERDDVSSSVELSHTQPYATTEGVSRKIELSSRRIDRLTVDASALAADFVAARLEYGYRLESAADSAAFEPLRRGTCRPPIGLGVRLPGLADCSRESALRLGIELRGTEFTAAGGASAQLIDWVSTNGHSSVSEGAVSTNVDEIDFVLGWRRDSRDRPVFGDSGLEQALTLRAALPGSDVEYYTAEYEVEQRLPLGERWTLRLRGQLGHGAAYGSDTSSLPPHLNWFAGGPRTVRGYRDGGLGPRDSLGNPYGGDTLLAGQLEVMTAWPQRWRENVRVGFFYDVGNVFYGAKDVAFYDEAGQPLDYGFDWSELRRSTGLALEVLLPFGLLRASYAVPLDPEEHPTSAFRRDDVERFQISFGVGF
jgi:outer membrane protein insertion porin family